MATVQKIGEIWRIEANEPCFAVYLSENNGYYYAGLVVGEVWASCYDVAIFSTDVEMYDFIANNEINKEQPKPLEDE